MKSEALITLAAIMFLLAIMDATVIDKHVSVSEYQKIYRIKRAPAIE